MLSFCAAAAWDESEDTWRTEDQVRSHLSQLIYCSQLIILANTDHLVQEGVHVDLSDGLREECAL